MKETRDLLSVIDSILNLFEDHNLSPEQGARISAKILMQSVSMMDSDEDVIGLISSLVSSELLPEDDLGQIRGAKQTVVFRPPARMTGVLSPARWGLDPSLIDDNN